MAAMVVTAIVAPWFARCPGLIARRFGPGRLHARGGRAGWFRIARLGGGALPVGLATPSATAATRPRDIVGDGLSSIGLGTMRSRFDVMRGLVGRQGIDRNRDRLGGIFDLVGDCCGRTVARNLVAD